MVFAKASSEAITWLVAAATSALLASFEMAFAAEVSAGGGLAFLAGLELDVVVVDGPPGVVVVVVTQLLSIPTPARDTPRVNLRTDLKLSMGSPPDMTDTAGIEAERLSAQRRLDLARSQTERNRRGQFATPTSLADDILRYAREHFGTKAVRFLDPAMGTGAFYGAVLRAFPPSRITRATGFEIDPYYGDPCRQLWASSGLRLRIEDFTRTSAPATQSQRYNLVICNPPYVRHHHLSLVRKRELQHRSSLATGIRLTGLAGLHAHFLLLAQSWMSRDALAGWLIPAEFMDVNYGAALKHYLLNRVTLLRIHRFEPTDVQFDDALVSSALVWLRNRPPATEHQVEMTVGGSLERPHARRRVLRAELETARKWRIARPGRRSAHDPSASSSVLGEFFAVRRGIATGANDFFIMTQGQAAARGIPANYLQPILPGPKDLQADEIAAEPGLVVLNCRDSQSHIKARHPGVWRYLKAGIGTVSEGYLCSRRTPWYSQEVREAPLFFCSYIARPSRDGRLQRFIFNRSRAIASNSYLMLYPRDKVLQFLGGSVDRARALWRELRAIRPEALSGAGRVYGGGMHKLEPGELAAVPVPGVAKLLREFDPPG
jgi:adenine-specific DNA-methyltransferase